jgi:acyl dehydratase
MTATLTELPSALQTYWAAARSIARRPGAVSDLPPLSLRLTGVRTEAARLAGYCAVCGLTPGQTLPLTYPQVAVAGLHMALMNQPKFPLPLLGLVHVRNRIRQERAIPVEAVYDAAVRIDNPRIVRAGLEFDLVTDVTVDGEPVWSAVTTIIHRQPGPKTPGAKPQKDEAASASLAQYDRFAVPEDTGRRYAGVSGDYNPIHVHALTAKLFGFPRAIAHGMWSVARCLGALEPQLAAPASALDVAFKQPLLLPGVVALKSVVDGEAIDFSLMSSKSGKVHLQGRLR